MNPEHRFSDRFREACKKGLPGHAVFFRLESSHTYPGLPDWCLCLPGGRILYIELKAEHGRATKAQIIVHRALANLGVKVLILTEKPNCVIVQSNVELGQRDIATLKDVVEKIVENSL